MSYIETSVSVAGGSLVVRDFGGDGAAVVMLHGGGQNLATWNEIAPEVARSSRVLTVDLRGHGRSADDGSASFRREAADVRALCGALALSNVILVGHSYGAAIAALCAANDDAYDGIVMLDQPLFGTWEEALAGVPPEDIAAVRGWTGTSVEAAALVEKSRRDAAAGLGERAGDVIAATVERALVEVAPGMFERRPRATYLRSMATADDDLPAAERRRYSMLYELYERIRCPMLLVFASEMDWAEDARRVEAQLTHRADVTIRWLEAGHFVHLQRPSEVVDLVTRFVLQVTRMPGHDL